MSQSEIEKAGQLAETVGASVREADGDLSAVYAALEKAALSYRESGGDLESAVPGSEIAALGFRRGTPRGKSIWAAYASVLRDDLCKPKGTLHKQVTTGVATTGATLVTMIIATLGIPTGAALLVGPIAGSILGLGVEAFCKQTAANK